ncbi:lipopolysaccharide biosynthesis protein [Synechococcus sp. MVIR-18-1]|uniref:lipopolysaccharide biosynthesis protein n=1 Tax=Synechococcus sp. MVIR-18-1 TaxID=1386941 RepID=UPI0016458E7A|nr:oligosaccharide flippase family protein [Synechococcus sp. MVIR-18-1]QNI75229.1 polysaccharide biosynthesis family protein [Synechococcus sp. MVIR-18-1]
MPSNIDQLRTLTSNDRLKFLLRDSILYGGSAAISKALALLTFPVLSRHFSVAEYGILDFFLGIGGLLATLFIFGQDSAVSRYFYEYTAFDARQKLISQSLFFQIGLIIVAAPILWIFADQIISVVFPMKNNLYATELFRLILLQFPFLLLINFSRNILKWTFDRKRFLTMTLGMSALQASGILIAVFRFDATIRTVLIVFLITNFIFGLLGLLFVRRWIVRPYNIFYLREMLNYAFPMGLICVTAAFLPTLERMLTERLLGSTDLGLFAAGSKIAMLIGLVIGAFQTAWGPFSLSVYKEEDASHTYNLVLRLFSFGVCLLVLLLTLFTGLIISILASNDYSGASVVVFPLCLGLAIQATSWISEVGIGISKRSHLNIYPYLASLIISLSFIYFFVPYFGLLGIGLGVLSGHIAKALSASWLAQRAYPLPWSYKPILLLFLVTTFIGFVAGWLGQVVSPIIESTFIIFGLVITSVLGFSLLFSREERRNLLKFIFKYIPS